MADLPDRYPGGWERLPIEVKRYLSIRVIEKQLGIQGGVSGIIEWLYRGDQREAWKGLPIAHKSGVIHYNATGMELWPLVVQDTKHWLDEREKKKTEPQHPGRQI